MDVDLSEPDVVLEPAAVEPALPKSRPKAKAKTRTRSPRKVSPTKQSLPEEVASGLNDLDIPEPTKPQALPMRLWSKMLHVVRDAIRKPNWIKRKFGFKS